MKILKLLSGLSMGRLAILAGLITVAYYSAYFNDGKVLEEQIVAATAQAESEDLRRKGIEKTMKKEEEMRGSVLQLERNLEVVKAKIPNEFRDTQMSAILNGASLATGVSLLELSTKPSTPKSQTVLDPNTLKPEDLIEEVKFNVVLTGSYEAFLKFLDVLTKEEKVIKIRNFIIEKNSLNIDDDLIKFRGEVVGFKQAVILANPTNPTSGEQ